MKIKTFIKEDGKIIDVYCHKSFNENHIGDCALIYEDENRNTAFYYDWNDFLEVNKIIECFDNRYFSNIKGKSHTIILENDNFIPNEIFNAAKYAHHMGVGKLPNKFQPFLGLSKSSHKEGYDKYLYDFIKDNEIKNVFMDSLFKDRDQFEHVAKKVFRWTVSVNVFVNSHSTLLSLLNEYSTDDNFIKLVSVCNVYDINFSENLVYKIDYSNTEKVFYYQSKYFINWIPKLF